jgi:hypothetical protein
MAESSRSRSRIRSRSRSRERAPSERSPCAGPPFRESSQDPDTIVITVDMGTVPHRSISLSNFPFTKVWDVKKKIYKEIERIPIKNQELFFLDRTLPSGTAVKPLKDGYTLSSYGIEDGAELRCIKWCKSCGRHCRCA